MRYQLKKLTLLKRRQMDNQQRIKEANADHQINIAYLSSLSENDLSEKLDTVHLQMELAEKSGNTSSMEILELWRTQIIEARIYKAENDIPDQASEIDIAISDVETVVARSEERIDALNEISIESRPEKTKRKYQEEANDDQLSLF